MIVPPERRDAVVLHQDRVRIRDEVLEGADVQLHVDLRGQAVGRLGHDGRKFQRHDLELLDGARREERDDLVVMDVDDAVDVGAEAKDLPVQLMADAGHLAAVEERARRHIGDHDVLERQLLEGDLRGLRIDDTVRERRVGDADRDVAEGVVDVAAGDDHPRVLQEAHRDPLVEDDL